VQSLALTTMVQGREKVEAPGMKADGGQLCMVVPEGQTASTPTMMLEPGFCYTVIGQGAGGVTELNLALTLDMATALPPQLGALAANPTLAVDQEAGSSASIGQKTSCYAWPWPVPAMVKVNATAKTGSGPVAIQIYKKKK
jgi:hypothetical protein